MRRGAVVMAYPDSLAPHTKTLPPTGRLLLIPRREDDMVVGDVIEMLDLFANVVTTDPVTALLFVFGNILLLGSIGVFGVLTLGSIAALFRPT